MKNAVHETCCPRRPTGRSHTGAGRMIRAGMLGWLACSLVLCTAPADVVAWQVHPDLESEDLDLQTLERDADRAYRDNNWEAALSGYRQILDRAPESLRARYRSGVCLLELDRFQEAADVFTECAESRAARRGSLYNLACALCQMDRKEDALVALEQAINAGYVNRRPIEKDDDLAPLIDDPRFQTLVEVHRESAKAAAELAGGKGPRMGIGLSDTATRVEAKQAVDHEEVARLKSCMGQWVLLNSQGEAVGTSEVHYDETSGVYQQTCQLNEGGKFQFGYQYDPVSGVWIQDVNGPEKIAGKLAGGLEGATLTTVGGVQSNAGRARATMTLTLSGDDSFVLKLVLSDNGGATWQEALNVTAVRDGTTSGR